MEANGSADLSNVAQIVSAYVSNNTVSIEDLSKVISEVSTALNKIANPQEFKPELKPAVKASKSVAEDHIICLEDGKKFKSLKRHLRTHYNLSPEEYRQKWGLPHDYPMVAPMYSQRRSELAKENGLGKKIA